MNKKEIQKQIKSYTAIFELADERLNELNLQLRDLCETEKPKLRHGDFGYENGLGRLSLKGLNGLMFSAGTGCCFDQNRGDKNHPTIILGNIFDLLKEWSEDLEHFRFDVHTYGIDPEQRHAPIKVAGNWHTLTKAEEIWHKLGQMIATLKRKQ